MSSALAHPDESGIAARPATDGQQRPSACPADLRSVLAAIWHETHPYRAAIHRSLSVDRCDLRVTNLHGLRPGGTGPLSLAGDCPCRDFLVDMIVEGHQLLAARAGELHNPSGAVRAHLRTRAAGDWIRRRRTEMGAQARVDRIRAGARARGLPDEFHRALLEYLVDEAGSMARLESQDALVSRLAIRCAAEFGGVPERYLDRVLDGVAVVERHCRSGPRVNAGTATEPDYVTWWERYVERPLGRRLRRTDLTISAVTGADDRGVDLPCPRAARDLERVVNGSGVVGGVRGTSAVAVLVEALRRQPEAPTTALRVGVFDLVERGLLAQQSATELLADRTRFIAATQALAAFA